MSRHGWLGAVLVAGGALVVGAAGAAGQAVAPPVAPVPGDLEPLARRMADEVRRLAEAVAADLKDVPRGRHLLEDANELARAVDEFRVALNDRADLFQARRAYSGLDATWHHLAAELSRPGVSSPGVEQAAQSVGQTDARLHRALGLNELTPAYYAGSEALTGMAEVQRLTHALVDRAEALAAVARAEMAGIDGGQLVMDAVNLAQAADTFHDALDLNGHVDAAVSNGFAGVAAMADRLKVDFRRFPPTPGVLSAFQDYRAAEVLLRKALGYRIEPEDLPGTLLAPPAGPEGVSPVIPLADQLVGQIAAFVDAFAPTAGEVPEGGMFLADARTLLAEATRFRQGAARGLSPAQLAFEFRRVDAIWRRLARRTSRIARGRTGPNIRQVGVMGATVAEIDRLLGMPGYAPVIGPGS